jgi:hypothetical protein
MEYFGIVKSVLTEGWPAILVPILSLIIPKSFLRGTFKGLGRTLSVLLTSRLGAFGQSVEDFIQDRLNAMHTGFNEGCDIDDSKSSK